MLCCALIPEIVLPNPADLRHAVYRLLYFIRTGKQPLPRPSLLAPSISSSAAALIPKWQITRQRLQPKCISAHHLQSVDKSVD